VIPFPDQSVAYPCLAKLSDLTGHVPVLPSLLHISLLSDCLLEQCDDESGDSLRRLRFSELRMGVQARREASAVVVVKSLCLCLG